MNKRNEWIGILLVGLGVVLLLIKFNILTIGWGTIWPLFLLVPGVLLEFAYFFHREQPGVLVPGGVLTITGLTFAVCAIFDQWGWMSFLWPMFPFSVAFGLFQLYIFGGKEKGLLIPVGILGGVAVIAFLTSILSAAIGGLIPIAMILLGVYIYFNGKRFTDSEM